MVDGEKKEEEGETEKWESKGGRGLDWHGFPANWGTPTPEIHFPLGSPAHFSAFASPDSKLISAPPPSVAYL